jgi:transporter family protein
VDAILFALVGAICWGIAPLFGKAGLRDINPLDGLVARTVITALLVTGVFIRRGGLDKLTIIPGRRWFFLAVEAFLATFAGDLGYYYALKKGAIGQTSLIMAAAPLITVWAGWYFLNEVLSPVKLFGAALVIIGVVMVGFK